MSEHKFNVEHTDDRREILTNTTLLDGTEISIIYLKKGKAIGGCVHGRNENFALLKGRAILVTHKNDVRCLNPGQGGVIEKWTPHAFKAMEDSVIMEYGLTPEEKINSPKDMFLHEWTIKVNKGTEDG
jgi:hypothetical protein